MNPIIVEDYNADWVDWFNNLARALHDNLKEGSYLDIIHLGSTSVPNLPAKPRIDIYILIRYSQLNGVIDQLENLGYSHQGDLGIADREAFRLDDPSILNSDMKEVPTHNLYTLIENSEEYYRMTLFQKYLTEFPDKAKLYGELKKKIAKKYDYSRINEYVEEKGVLIQRYIREAYEHYGRTKWEKGVSHTPDEVQ